MSLHLGSVALRIISMLLIYTGVKRVGKTTSLLCSCFAVELMFLETSALTGENVEEMFLKCARSILTKIESGTISTFQ